ncbi:competence protein ComFB [Idiomarina tyrosinivorans]|uniref:Competence protein ComFB n=1 Tax=Idiomarina tyrosinivorans TaxID=1445662 RepID=A0A432ZLD7_9GAMM|nr:late competence development ComFB family protein [Idiomarina tyrosinivorans]RUO78778.1 competence protein ComFB [Idiomarina tyrosinivorans]
MNYSDDIHNYYERLVGDRIEELELQRRYDQDFLADLCCLVLNQLPPRYIRHEVDMAFFLPPSKRLDMEMQVHKAVNEALEFLTERNKSQNKK